MELKNIGSKIDVYVLTYDLGPILFFKAEIIGIAFGPVTHFCEIIEGQPMGKFKEGAKITILANGLSILRRVSPIRLMKSKRQF